MRVIGNGIGSLLSVERSRFEAKENTFSRFFFWAEVVYIVARQRSLAGVPIILVKSASTRYNNISGKCGNITNELLVETC